ncbi:methyl-accepting chemotaxis protein [uncultured Oscillibacter sp.]|jgi:methyl-accepting chemotaxis protein|uniref:methyl-accepting chemotaxis protein n=2 Tax=Oscillibacter TaxID=459786 RepID=UPI0021748E63|nr:methyl-accepting chemotaxis protein [uncultured Oscillibacter sp.]MCI8841669.1 methyl-accepting chemotaxis protein [Oscillibacter sp.]
MNSIRKKITVCLMATVLAALFVVGGASIGLNYRSTIATVDQMMTQTAVLAAERIEEELIAYKNVAMDTGRITQLADSDTPLEEKRSIIDERASLHGFQRGNVIGLDGISIFDGKDYSDREYVQQALSGNVYVSQPLVSKITGELTIMVAAPLYSNRGLVAGAVYFVPPETFLNDIVSSIKVSENSRAYMINKDGDTIADITLETITTQNIEREAQSDSSLKQLAAIHAEMRQGKVGFGSFHDTDGPRFAAYAPVDGTNGWSVAVTAMKKDYLADTYFGMLIDVLVIVASILASIVVALKLSSNISDPMRACAQRMKLLVEGDLKAPVPQTQGKDETAELTRSTAEMVTGLNTIINDISYLLTEMANQNLDIRSAHREAYVGDFQNILQSMRTLKVELSGTMRQINASAGQVSSASNQVSMGAQSLSQGSMTQASSIEELAATITEISDSAKRTAAAAEEAGRFVGQAGGQLGISVEHVKGLNAAMEKISGSSEEISKIIATIENIAFQTNILALNAAVEAARAGSAGKGFAVVADEVRNLATKSDQAAKATKELIESSIAAVTEGSRAVGNVTESLERTSESAGHVTAQMDIVVEAVENQTSAINQVTEGIDQISSVVQTNSATAQESAAASEELSAEAASLKQLVDQFTLAKD